MLVPGTVVVSLPIHLYATPCAVSKEVHGEIRHSNKLVSFREIYRKVCWLLLTMPKSMLFVLQLMYDTEYDLRTHTPVRGALGGLLKRTNMLHPEETRTVGSLLLPCFLISSGLLSLCLFVAPSLPSSPAHTRAVSCAVGCVWGAALKMLTTASQK